MLSPLNLPPPPPFQQTFFLLLSIEFLITCPPTSFHKIYHIKHNFVLFHFLLLHLTLAPCVFLVFSVKDPFTLYTYVNFKTMITGLLNCDGTRLSGGTWSKDVSERTYVDESDSLNMPLVRMWTQYYVHCCSCVTKTRMGKVVGREEERGEVVKTKDSCTKSRSSISSRRRGEERRRWVKFKVWKGKLLKRTLILYCRRPPPFVAATYANISGCKHYTLMNILL